MTGVFRAINAKKIIGNVTFQIIWCINADCRQTKVLQDQAKFINSLGTVWASVLIVCKNCTEPKTHLQGAKDAAKSYTDLSVPALGLTRFDLLEPDNFISRMSMNANYKDRIKDNMAYLKRGESEMEIMQRLSKLSSFPIRIRNEKCTKCNETGDSRGFRSECHPGKEEIHGNHKTYKHKSDKETKTKEMYHDGIYTAWGNVYKLRTAATLFTGEAAGMAAAVGGVSATGVTAATAGAAGAVLMATGGIAMGAAGGMYLAYKLLNPDEKVYTCCGTNNQGCKPRTHTYYPCCDGGEKSQGCETLCSSCKRPVDSVGCLSVCKSCKQPWGTSQGCEEKTHQITTQ